MANVRFFVTRPAAGGTNEPAAGVITCTPTRRRIITGTPDELVLPTGFSVEVLRVTADDETIDDAIQKLGYADIALAETGPDWCWQITFQMIGVASWSTFVQVGPAAEYDFPDLPVVDPETLDPAAEPEAAWWAMADSTVVDGAVVGDDLVLTRYDGGTVNAGNVRGPVGPVSGDTVVGGQVVGDDLILTQQDGDELNAGNVRGPVGPVSGDTVVGGQVVGDDLILTQQDGDELNAGNVRGPVGPVSGDTVVGGQVVGDDLILTQQDGDELNAGNVRGPVGPVSGDTVVGGQVVGDDLVLTQQDGDEVNAGNVRGPKGDQGAPGNATMRVDTSVGTRIYITDGVAERMVSGDTGWKIISYWGADGVVMGEPLPPGLEPTANQSGRIRLKRVNNRVAWDFRGLTFTSATPSIPTPIGYRPGLLYSIRSIWLGSNHRRVSVGSDRIYFIAGIGDKADQTFSTVLEYDTDADWPTA